MPDFIENAHLRQLALILVALAFISVLYALFLNPLFGLIMLVLVIIVLILAYRRLEQVNTDTNEYISNLSYRMKRGEEDAMLKMPIGILFYDDNAKIEWYNPRMK